MRRICMVGVAGGVGCTTAAAMLALLCRQQDEEVLFTSRAHRDDRRCILGVAEGIESFDAKLDFEDCGVDYGIEVVDVGTNADALLDPHDGVVLCMRNDYVSLRRAAAHPWSTGALLVMQMPGSVLTLDDIESVTHSSRIRVVRWTDSMSRAIDAGLLPTLVSRRQFADIFEALR